LGKQLINASLILLPFLLAGGDWEWNPRDSDFLKVQFGDVRIDFGAGLTQVIRMLLQMGIKTGEKIEVLEPETSAAAGDFNALSGVDVFRRFMEYKLHPFVGMTGSLFTGTNSIGEVVDWRLVPQEGFVPPLLDFTNENSVVRNYYTPIP